MLTPPAPLVGSFASGDLEIDWNIAAPKYNTGQIKIKIQGTEVANHLFSPGNYQWAPPAIGFGGDTLNFSMMFQPASAAANGELTLVSLTLQQADGTKLSFQNFQVQGWDSTGAPQIVRAHA